MSSQRRTWLLTLHAYLLHLYPPSHRVLFAAEMHAVFADALQNAAIQGWRAVAILCWRELRDLPQSLVAEYWYGTQQWIAAQLHEGEAATDLPGVVPVGYGSLPHILFALMGRNPRLRRLFDIALAMLGLALTAPLLLLLPLFIKLDSTGPIFYCQKRLGANGRSYLMYKFRSMYVNRSPCIPSSTPSSSTDDPRVTRIGRLARRLRLDELPQLFNVLKGEMSIFGPRPPMPK